MLKFTLNIEDRKTLVKRISELTGLSAMYMRTPTYAYKCGDYTIDRDGNLLVDEEKADADTLTTLMSEGMIAGGEVVTEEECAPDTENGADFHDNEVSENLESGGDSTESAETERSAYLNDEESDAENGDNAPVLESGDQQETETEAAAQEDTIDMNMAFPIPIGRHNGTSLRNLINLIYSRGALINKATGGHFSVEEELVEALKDDSCTYSKANFFKMVGDYETQHGKSIYGLTITPEEVRFTGFGEAPDMEHLTAYGQLAVLMNEQAINQKRIQAKTVDDTNEKYAMRIWLVRIGMGGDEFKQTRKVLMERLGGHTAFRTPADAEKAKEKAQKKRDALRVAKAEAAVASTNAEHGPEGDGQNGDL